ncbi:MAG TPA: hypothetical protein VGL38_11745 [bacterium]|jgi:hypothetical protein
MKILHVPLILLPVLLLLAGSTAFAQSGSGQSPHGNLALNCEDCHTTEGWRPIKASPVFNHQTTRFPLEGRHVQVQCASCHTTLDFAKAGTQCKDCHLDVHRGQFAYACSECHTPVQWNNEREMAQRHQTTRFALTGVHANVDCEACHATGQYAGVSTNCGSCHLAAYQSAADPNHVAAGFSMDCSQCHSVTTVKWQNASFNHALSGFVLTGQHARATCGDCHTVNGQVRYSGIGTDCYNCHQANFQSATNPDHAAGNFGHNCGVCHSTNGWSPASFDHNLARFTLTGAHTSVECTACHTVNGQPRYTGTPSDCYTCHQTNFQNSTNPNHVTGNFPHECTQCHTTAAWQPATFDHNLSTFPLTGAHVNTQCAQCHTNGQFANTPTACYSCHQTNFQNSTNPNHVTGNFPHECAQCHGTGGWSPATFDHSLSTFPLTGRHVQASCTDCHVNGQFTGTPTDCFSCHQTNFQNSTNPNHVTGNFPHECAQCHTTAGWSPASFDHSQSTFPLTGAHVNVQCAQCHVNGQFANTPTDCYSCHTADFNGANNPGHASQNFPHDCRVCHNTVGWQPSTFDHQTSAFPLTGRHRQTGCTQCHVNGQYVGTPTACYSCHQSDYQRAENHVAQGYPHDCTQCHTTNGWDNGNFNHANTGFPLNGRHTTQQCASCHANGNFVNTPSECVACHRDAYEGAFNPPHVQGQFSQQCHRCHVAGGWQPSTFAHSSTGYELSGAHVALACRSCHQSGPYNRTPQDCYTCHLANYQGVTDPNHVSNQFDHNCLTCHSNTAWTPATFNHNNTPFPLTGAHQTTACNLCHAGGHYHGTPTDCFSCHQTDFQNVTDPNHVSNQFDHNCLTCHSTTAWNPATFNHSNTSFPLTGVHVTTACNLCHVNGQYAGTPTDCFFCHQTDYNGATNPNHQSAHFPTTCTTCHTTTGWTPSTFNHDGPYFPIYSGNHRTAWSTCADCHANPSDYTVFSCIDCHAHTRSQTDGQHNEVSGYVYDSQHCYACHPRGSSGGVPPQRLTPRGSAR